MDDTANIDIFDSSPPIVAARPNITSHLLPSPNITDEVPKYSVFLKPNLFNEEVLQAQQNSEIELKFVPLETSIKEGIDTVNSDQNLPEFTQLMNTDYQIIRNTYHFPSCYNDDLTKSAICNIPLVTIFTAILSLVCIVSVVGNLLVLVVVSKTKFSRRPPSVYKASLAVADLLLSLFVIPAMVYNIFTNILAPSNGVFYAFDEARIETVAPWIRRVTASTTLVSMTASVLTLLTMSVDRLVAIRWPLWHRIEYSTINRASLSIAFVWIVSIIPMIAFNLHLDVTYELQPYTMTFGPVLGFEDLEGLSTVRFFGIVYSIVLWFTPWVLTTILTIGVGFYGWRSLKSMRDSRTKAKSTNYVKNIPPGVKDSIVRIMSRTGSSNLPQEDQQCVIRAPREKTLENKNDESSKRLVKTLSILVTMYTICTLPLTILQLYMWSGTTSQSIGGEAYRWIWFLASFLFLLQSALNIFIYHRSQDFREEIKSVFSLSRSSTVTSKGATSNGTRSTGISSSTNQSRYGRIVAAKKNNLPQLEKIDGYTKKFYKLPISNQVSNSSSDCCSSSDV